MRDEGVIYVAGNPLLNRRCIRLSGCIRLRNDLYCVGWGVKLYSLTLLERFRNWIISTWSNASRGFLSALSFFSMPLVRVPNSQQASAARLSSWTESSSCAPVFSFSASNFTNLWSSNWRICARSSNSNFCYVNVLFILVPVKRLYRDGSQADTLAPVAFVYCL